MDVTIGIGVDLKCSRQTTKAVVSRLTPALLLFPLRFIQSANGDLTNIVIGRESKAIQSFMCTGEWIVAGLRDLLGIHHELWV